MEIGRIIETQLDQLGKNQVWLAEKLGWNFKTLNGKINRNSFTWDELLKVAHVLNIDLNELKSKISEDDDFVKQEIIHLFRQLENKMVTIDLKTIHFSGLISIDELTIQEINDDEILLSDGKEDPEHLAKASITFDYVDNIDHGLGCFTINATDGSEFIVTWYENGLVLHKSE